MRAENLRKTPDFVERVVERRRRDADDIRFAEIAFHVGGLEFLEEFFWMFVRQDRQLAVVRAKLK
jgi:hypothetical protein